MVLLVLGGITLTAGDIVFKFWIERSLPYLSVWYMSGLMLYIASLVFLVESFRSENIAVASVILVLLNIVFLALFSYFYFGDKLTLLQMLGLVLALLSISLLELGR